MADSDAKNDSARQESLIGVSEGLASQYDAAVLGLWACYHS